MTNTNCLEGIKCPDCGNEESFRIAARTIATVTDDGTEDYGDMEWDDDSYAECAACLRHGTLKDFREAAKAKPTPAPWTMARHTAASDYGEDAYTLFPHMAIIIGIDPTTAGLIEAAPALLDALRLAQRALNAAPRFRVGDTDSYKIAAQVDQAIETASTRRQP